MRSTFIGGDVTLAGEEMMMRRRAPVVIFLAALGLALAACGGCRKKNASGTAITKTFDAGDVQVKCMSTDSEVDLSTLRSVRQGGHSVMGEYPGGTFAFSSPCSSPPLIIDPAHTRIGFFCVSLGWHIIYLGKTETFLLRLGDRSPKEPDWSNVPDLLTAAPTIIRAGVRADNGSKLAAEIIATKNEDAVVDVLLAAADTDIGEAKSPSSEWPLDGCPEPAPLPNAPAKELPAWESNYVALTAEGKAKVNRGLGASIAKAPSKVPEEQTKLAPALRRAAALADLDDPKLADGLAAHVLALREGDPGAGITRSLFMRRLALSRPDAAAKIACEVAGQTTTSLRTRDTCRLVVEYARARCRDLESSAPEGYLDAGVAALAKRASATLKVPLADARRTTICNEPSP